MKAVLITRCNCRRDIEVPYPPPPDFLVPLLAKDVELVPWEGDPQWSNPMETRRFQLVLGTGRTPFEQAQYLEVE